MLSLTPRFASVARLIPVTLVVLLSAPAWLTWPFLGKERRDSVLSMVKELAEWTRNQDAPKALDQSESS